MPHLTDEAFAVLRDLVANECGLYLAEEKRSFLERRVHRRLQQIAVETPVAYVDHIQYHAAGREELLRLIESVAVLETHFFRHQEQFELLEKDVLAQLVRERLKVGQRRFRAWSAGCATGEEAYSIAISFARAVGRTRSWDVEILGSDLCHGFVERARQGSYPATSFREVEPAQLADWVQPADDRYRPTEAIRSMTLFRTHNLIKDGFPFKMDVIFCRNVIIYFPREVSAIVIRRLKDSLAVGGVLFIGSAETMGSNAAQMETISNGDAVAYRRLA